jgi:hypothetical protein
MLTADTKLLMCARTSGWTVSLVMSECSIVSQYRRQDDRQDAFIINTAS